MPSFGPTSLRRLETVHPKLRAVLDEAIKSYDFTVLVGYRGEAEQNEAFSKGNSPLRYPDSKHNTLPSRAVDVAPWPQVFKATNEDWHEMATHVLRAAAKLRVDVRWGGHFTTFFDGPHFELGPDE